MIIEPGSKRLEELVTQFWSLRLRYPFEPPKVKIYTREEYIKETGNDKTPARYSAKEDKIATSPDIIYHIKLILHELAHHYQGSRDGAVEFDRRYDEYTKDHGYIDNPYEVEARELEAKWWPEFERLLEKKLEEIK